MDKIALITGASKGIGKEISIELAKNKIKLILVSRNYNDLKKLKKTINEKINFKHVEIISGDVSHSSTVTKVLKLCRKTYGFPNIVVNNTGGPLSGNFKKFKIYDWNKYIKNNLLSVINFTNVFHKEMIRKKWGRFITISSTIAKEPTSNMVMSATLRSGVSAFNKAISFDLAKYKITVNTILLGGVKTGRLYKLIKKNSKKKGMSYSKYLKNVESSIPIGRFAEPKEISDLVGFLISDKGSYITGQNIIIDGGLSKSI